MNLVKYKADKIKTVKSFEGLFRIEFEHELKETKASVDWAGPFIPPDEWHKMMSFFRWTNDTMHSESQVRLFVNTVTKTWRIWAFPQEANTGMSAKELQTEDTKTQRAQFPDNEGWLYFGTAHHHCGCSAFQSGTDQSNEENQDGIHITIGNMGSARHDIHSRLYINGCKFDPDLSKFWDVGDMVRDNLPQSFWGAAAAHQMTNKIEMAFPDQWRTNLIHRTVVQTSPGFFGYPGANGSGGVGSYASGSGHFSHSGRSYVGGGSDWKRQMPFFRRREVALQDLANDIKFVNGNLLDLQEILAQLANDDTGIVDMLVRACKEYDLDIEDLEKELTDQIDRQEALRDSLEEQAEQRMLEEGGRTESQGTAAPTQKQEPQSGGIPDYDPSSGQWGIGE